MTRGESKRQQYGIPTVDAAGEYLERRFTPLQRVTFDIVCSLGLTGGGIASIVATRESFEGTVGGAILVLGGFACALRGGMSLQEAVTELDDQQTN